MQVVRENRGMVAAIEGVIAEHDREGSPAFENRNFVDQPRKRDAVAKIAIQSMQAGWPARRLCGLREDLEIESLAHTSSRRRRAWPRVN